MNRRDLFKTLAVLPVVALAGDGNDDYRWRLLADEVPEHGQLCDVKTVADHWSNHLFGKRCVHHEGIVPCAWHDKEKGLYVGDPKITWWRIV